MNQYIDKVCTGPTSLEASKHYPFPGRDHDQLFKATCPHVRGVDCSSCDKDGLEKRLDRESDYPVVHYGLIASGNTVMSSAQRRDELRDTWDICCFEMEAAGLMNDFPCILIRGISDYSDGHKNDNWQPYAAVAAAAYAKDLLRIVHPQEVDHTEAAANALKDRTSTHYTEGLAASSCYSHPIT